MADRSQYYDAFLPSGAIEPPRFSPELNATFFNGSHHHLPRSVPDYYPHQAGATSQLRSPNQIPNRSPISPPLTRSASRDHGSAALIEHWRQYTERLRQQAQGERAHMMADRDRMEEIMAEERQLWDTERQSLKARVAELEDHLYTLMQASGQGLAYSSAPQTIPGCRRAHSRSGPTSPPVPQDSGRNPDGTPFYARVPEHPNRTFAASNNDGLRVDDISVPEETPLRVTAKALTSADFGVNSPNAHDVSNQEESVVGDSFDISHIDSTLDSVPIKVTAASPSFIQKVISPTKLSPRVSPPPRPEGCDAPEAVNIEPAAETEPAAALKPVFQVPEFRRLTMHAGHTPSHSITNLKELMESGSATPTQVEIHVQHQDPPTDPEDPEVADIEIDEDPALEGPLGLKNNPVRDEIFLSEVNKKLLGAISSGKTSPTALSPSCEDEDEDMLGRGTPVEKGGPEDIEGLPKLKIKQSMNFGRPFGAV